MKIILLLLSALCVAVALKAADLFIKPLTVTNINVHSLYTNAFGINIETDANLRVTNIFLPPSYVGTVQVGTNFLRLKDLTQPPQNH